MKPYTYERSPIYKRIEAAVKSGPMVVIDVCNKACTDRRHCCRILNHMHDKGYIHIGDWRTGARGPVAPIYHWGPGQDAEKPAPLDAAAKCAQYRKAMRAKHGENYPIIRKAQRKSVLGRKIIVEGKVIYEQAPR